jgi:hypothetical protein
MTKLLQKVQYGISADPNAMVEDLGKLEGGAMTYGLEVAEGITSVGVSPYDLIDVLLANVFFGVWGY